MKNSIVSVVVPTYNNENLIEKCIKSILNQSFKDFELIIVDDCSKDKTIKILKKIKDKRLKILKTSINGGSAIARNLGVANSSGKYIFFTDGDCIASKNWIKNGVKVFEKEKCLGVEGKIYYVSKDHKPDVMENEVENFLGGAYMGANIAYSKKVLDLVKGYDNQLIRMQDRDLALKVLKKGKIIFAPNMLVTHQKFYWTFKKKMRLAKEGAKTNVILFKRYKDNNQIFWRIYQPLNLLALFFPPIVLGLLFTKRFRKFSDLKVLLWTYSFVVVERFSLWKNAIKERVFLI